MLVFGCLGSVVVLAVLAAGALWAMHKTNEAPNYTPGPAPTEAQSKAHPSADGKPKPAKGYTLRDDPAGFRLALPRSWHDRRASGNSVTYFNPEHTAYVLVDRTAQPTANPMINMRRFIRDARRDGKYRDSHTLSLHRMRYLGAPAAAWEFTWEMDNGTPVHAEDRQVVLPEGEFVAVYWQSLDRMWAATRKVRGTAFSTLRLR